MFYQKISFESISYTEPDRKELENIFGDRTPQGVGKVIDLTTVLSKFISRLLKNFPIDNIAVLHYTTPNEYLHGTMLKRIHTDPRPVALNIPIKNCDQNAKTVYYSNDSVIPAFTGSTGEYKSTAYKESLTGAVEIDSFCLDMQSAVLLRTDIPHAKIQTTDSKRMFLSVTPTVSFDEFLQILSHKDNP